MRSRLTSRFPASSLGNEEATSTNFHNFTLREACAGLVLLIGERKCVGAGRGGVVGRRNV